MKTKRYLIHIITQILQFKETQSTIQYDIIYI